MQSALLRIALHPVLDDPFERLEVDFVLGRVDLFELKIVVSDLNKLHRAKVVRRARSIIIE
ncbi:hypothetical protein AS96_15015 [Microbacterium sp. MRS-1]|nr:hypothetical protein AS96_15015 [Microbacterium sp. MRS-1]